VDAVKSDITEIDPFDWTPVSQKIAWKLRNYGECVAQYAQTYDQMEVYLKNEGEIGSNKKDSRRLLIFTVLRLFGDGFTGSITDVETLNIDNFSTDVTDLIEVLTTGHISQDKNTEYQFRMVNLVTEVGEIIKIVHNVLCGKSFYQCTERVLATSFDHCKHIVFSFHSLNE
jgi:hypothetical protein